MKRKKPESFGWCWGALLPLLAAQALAQSEGGGGRPALVIEPRLSVSETLTDNVKLRSQNKDAALITSISPGVRISSNSGRLRGSLDYSLNGMLYSKSNEPSRVQNNLYAQGRYDAIDNWAFVDARASIAQQARSAFGTTSNDPTLVNDNSSELYTLNISPGVKGQLAGVASYELKAEISEARAKDSTVGDLSNRGLTLRLGGLSSQSLLSWSAMASQQRWRPAGGRETENSMVTGSLVLRPDIEWNVGLTLGKERNSFTTVSRQSGNTYGASANWQPTPRTRLALDWQHHDYGDSHTISFEHRMARSVWRFIDSQMANVGGPNASGGGGATTNYDLFFALFAGQEPDVRRRDVLVRRYLALIGLNPNAVAIANATNSTASLSRRQDFSFALEGVRSSMTFLIGQTRSSKLDPINVGQQDDFSQTNHIRMRNLAVSFAHRLTPTSSANLTLSEQQSRGDLASQRSDLTSIAANWNARLGGDSNVTLGLRHNRFDSPSQPYRENAVLATYTQQF